MPEKSIHSSLHASFPEASREMWQQAASQEIEGKDPFVELSWESRDAIRFYPYYGVHDVTPLIYLKRFQHAADENSFLGSKKWLNVPYVSVNEITAANKISLGHLAHGADGIFFYITANADANANALLQDIEWTYCALFFHAANDDFFLQQLPAFIAAKDNAKSFMGALFWESSPKKGAVDFYLQSTPNLKCLGITINASSPVKEIAEALAAGVAVVEHLKEEHTIAALFHAIAFSVAADTDFFECIAKLKALRLLWYQVAHAYGVKEYELTHLHIHVRSESWVNKNFEPHSNMIKGTTAAMASILGGCDSLTVLAQDEHHTTMNRIARNVSSILREESHFNKVADPLAGAYAIDTMVHEFAKNAWTLFQANMKA
jgi:methylmalonyl-CoA mutase